MRLSIFRGFKKAYDWLLLDCLLYMQCDQQEVFSLPLCCLQLFLTSRDFRMNVLVRFSCVNVIAISAISRSLLFYLYGSTLSPSASINVPLRFSHARSVVIGGNVVFEGPGFAYIFNNVTLGKASPMVADRAMPTFRGKCFFGVGSVVLGSVIAEGDVVFGANSFVSNKIIPPSSTVLNSGLVRNGVFFDNIEHPFLPLRCDGLSQIFSKFLT